MSIYIKGPIFWVQTKMTNGTNKWGLREYDVGGGRCRHNDVSSEHKYIAKRTIIYVKRT